MHGILVGSNVENLENGSELNYDMMPEIRRSTHFRNYLNKSIEAVRHV